jgi:hypothetical protein
MPQTRSSWIFAARGALVLLILALLLPFYPGTIEPVQAARPCGAGTNCSFLPLIPRGHTASGDLQIVSVEVTQGVQNSTNSVPLVAGRSTILRIYASGQEALPAGSSNIQIAISASPALPSMASAPLMLSGDLEAAPSRSEYASTINVPLPASWATGSYDLSITIDPHNQVAEEQEGNNTFVQHVSFNDVPTLRIKIVPVIYTHTDGHRYPAPTKDSISSWILRLFPLDQVEISWHAPYAFSGNLKELASFSALLSQVNSLKKSEGAPADQVYYALVPTSDGSLGWFNGGLVGMGYIGYRVSVGLDYYNAGLTAAHEIAHNLGRYHSPCGSVSSPDPDFPYPDGSIGEFGLDTTTGQVYSPAASRDFMSYCSPKWVSDYTYQALLDAQLRTAATSLAAAEQELAPLMVVRANIGADGATIAPIYAMQGMVDAPVLSSDYHLQMLGTNGQVLADVPVQALEVATEGAEAFEIQTNLPRPSAPVQAVRLLKAGEVLARIELDGTRTLGEKVTRLAFADTFAAGTMLDLPPGRPALVRYSLDGGQSWMNLAMDVSTGQLDLSGAGLPPTALIEVVSALSQ